MVMGDMAMTVDLVVIGAGAGGCAAAIRGAELGLDVALVDTFDAPGGNYLYNTCIPSQTCHDTVSRIIDFRQVSPEDSPDLDTQITIQNICKRTISKIDTISKSLITACKQSGVLYVKGEAYFEGSTSIRLKDSEVSRLLYQHAIVATGALPAPFPENIGESRRILSAAEAFTFKIFPETLLIIGAGHTGLELGYLYASLGCQVEIIDENSTLLPCLDQDITDRLKDLEPAFFNAVHLSTRAESISETAEKVKVKVNDGHEKAIKTYDMVIWANGYIPASDNLGLENTKAVLTENGFIVTDNTLQTTDPAIYAVGDVTSEAMYNHLATRQGKIAAEVISGMSSALDIRAIPCTIKGFGSISWCGLLEQEATDKQIPVVVYARSWQIIPHAIATGCDNGYTKIVVSADDKRVLGAVIMGYGSEDRIMEMVLAIEMGALIDDLSLTLHPHPAFTELSQVA